MKISKKEYRKLVRNSMRLKILKEMVKSNMYIGRDEMILFLGDGPDKRHYSGNPTGGHEDGTD